ncbi:hypothetical protein B0I26_101355 [Anoxybacillus vitaminiphilus]|jgi:bacteriorhodopsin|uniref:Uncharacterized protein n=1 Tax=Paranoxybacillus vitaminiphilus TaxID=581036 RepID=A0A327YQH1_9BACL|nr:hypothetical protein [Anoxybacillus vitaminiphilus]RAK23394.1 hypothetical protein B0I26_101355 [Anoxybacillus vitaminiphilus]
MAGTWIFNLLLGLFGFFIVFLLSFTGNTILTTFIRSFITFILFFLIGYIFRWMFAYIKADQGKVKKIANSQPPVQKENEIEQLLNSLSDEEAKKVAQYIRNMLNDQRRT